MTHQFDLCPELGGLVVCVALCGVLLEKICLQLVDFAHETVALLFQHLNHLPQRLHLLTATRTVTHQSTQRDSRATQIKLRMIHGENECMELPSIYIYIIDANNLGAGFHNWSSLFT